MKDYRIALVDDHKLFRSGIAMLIKTFPGYRVIFEAGNGKEFCEKMNSALKPDIVLLDLSMPEMDGIETSAWIKKNHPKIHVIVLSMFQDEEKVVELVKNGIKGYLLKDSEPEEFKTALDVVAASDIYFPPFVTKHLVGNVARGSSKISLNNSEIRFLKLVSTELTYKEIAQALAVSERTVDSYREHIFAKLNLKNRTGLVLYAIRNKLIEV